MTIPFHEDGALIIASDNSGAIGLKPGNDLVHVPYETVAYYSFRVAVMECIAAGGDPFSVVLHNFCGNEPWAMLTRGIQKGLVELHLQDVPITGSTESNFSLLQSALGMIVIGKRDRVIPEETILLDQMEFAVIGSPLVGEEVLNKEGEVLPLSLFQFTLSVGSCGHFTCRVKRGSTRVKGHAWRRGTFRFLHYVRSRFTQNFWPINMHTDRLPTST